MKEPKVIEYTVYPTYSYDVTDISDDQWRLMWGRATNLSRTETLLRFVNIVLDENQELRKQVLSCKLRELPNEKGL